jgi:acyl dehydratase
MWKYILELYQQYFTSTFDVKKLHLDFEAAKEIFPNVMIVTYRFHLGQAWWRKVIVKI